MEFPGFYVENMISIIQNSVNFRDEMHALQFMREFARRLRPLSHNRFHFVRDGRWLKPL